MSYYAIEKGTTLSTLEVQLTDRDGLKLDLTTATSVLFYLRSSGPLGATVINGASCPMRTPLTDGKVGGPTNVLSTAGRYLGYFVVAFPGAITKRVPSSGYLLVEVEETFSLYLPVEELRARLPLDGEGISDDELSEAIGAARDYVVSLTGDVSGVSAVTRNAVAKLAHADALDIVFPRDVRSTDAASVILRQNAEAILKRHLDAAAVSPYGQITTRATQRG